MELNDLIPDRSEVWEVRKKYLTYKKYVNIPVAYIEDNVVYVFLDIKIKKVLLKLIKHLMDKDIEFYLLTPALSNPSGIENYKDRVIGHYFYCYCNIDLHTGFNKIGFDLINNMVKWSEKNDCYELIKPNFDIMLKKVNASQQDWYSNKVIYEYSEEIRQDFKTLYRDIQINKII